jgi:hypothetical protein
MQGRRQMARALVTLAGVMCSVAIVLAIGDGDGFGFGHFIRFGVPFGNLRVDSPDNVIAPGFKLVRVAQGTDPLENPSGPITSYGYLSNTAKTKTEPDENTYLVFDHNPGGPTPGYNYGRHFLYQGHENGAPLAYITRINLDVADPQHRITLLTPVDQATGNTGFGSIDGSTWDPFTRTLLFTQERSSSGGVIEVTAGWPAQVRTLDGILGKGGYEGIHPDDHGNLIIVEDVGGAGVPVDKNDPTSPAVAKQPNSFVYRFVPKNPADLGQGGKLYALRASVDGAPLTFHAADPVGDTFAAAQRHLHRVGSSWPANWVLIHDTSANGFAAFDANAAAKAAGATPFKRPENAQFLPGSGFNTFFFAVTGDTDARSGSQPELAARGAWGALFRVDFLGASPIGRISCVVLGDADHAAFDNIAFATNRTLLAAEDRGELLHGQLNLLDSVWAYDVRRHGDGDDDDDDGDDLNPRRFIALGRDPVATNDAIMEGEGDNEPTGLHVSDGVASIFGMQGALLLPHVSRSFITQQHGMNQTFEIVQTRR